MENPRNGSGKSPNLEWIITLLHLIASYYSELIARPFRSGLVYFLAGLLPALFIFWIIYPMALYSKQEQPLNFSHAVHMDEDRVDGIEGDTEAERCLYCHAFRKDGTFVGIPKLETCTECHDDPDMAFGESADEEQFLRDYVADAQEVPWLSYSRQPDCVYFSHIAHVTVGGVDCKTCHGTLAETDRLPVYQKNRISGYSINIWGTNIVGYKKNPWDRMKMDDCAECHTQRGHEEHNACFVCHK
jgi:hypothetical protein